MATRRCSKEERHGAKGEASEAPRSARRCKQVGAQRTTTARGDPTAGPAVMRGSANGLRVRMYRVGFGDFFLLTVPTKSAGPQHILIDCGVHAGNIGSMPDCVADLIAVTRAQARAGHRHALSRRSSVRLRDAVRRVRTVRGRCGLDHESAGPRRQRRRWRSGRRWPALANHLRLQLQLQAQAQSRRG